MSKLTGSWSGGYTINLQVVDIYLNPEIVLALAGLTLTFHALFAKILVKFDDRYSKSLLYFFTG